MHGLPASTNFASYRSTGPGLSRAMRLRYSSDGASAPRGVDNAEVEVRDLSVYEQLLEGVGLEVMP